MFPTLKIYWMITSMRKNFIVFMYSFQKEILPAHISSNEWLTLDHDVTTLPD